MIFVITGTERFSFHRLVKEVEAVASEMPDRAFFMQIGSSTHEPVACRWERYVPFPDMMANIEGADLVISHAGAGAVLLCSQLGKRPVIVPRRRHLREHVDDHQVLFASRLNDAGVARAVFDPSDLREAVGQELARGVAVERTRGGRDLAAFFGRLLADA